MTKTSPVRVKDGMSLRNGMWHGLRNDIIMRNVIYAEWLKEINKQKSMFVVAAPFLAPIWRSNRFAGPFITAGSNQQGTLRTLIMEETSSSGELYCISLALFLQC